MQPIAYRTIGAFNARGIFTMIERSVKNVISFWPEYLLGPCVSSLLFLLVLSLAGGAGLEIWPGVSFAEFLAPGMIASSLLHSTFGLASAGLLHDKMIGAIQDVLAAPLSPLEFILGHLAGAIVCGLMVGCAVTLAFFLFVPIELADPFLLLAFLLLGSLFFALLGFIAGLWAEKWDHNQAAESFLVQPLSMLSGTFFTVASLPAFGQVLLTYNPVFHAIDGIRAGFLGRADGDLWLGAGVLLALNVALFFWLWHLVRRGYRLKP